MSILRSDFIDEEEVKYYFCACDMVTQTYRSATQSGVTQIAYHFERPMLVTNVGGLAEIIPHNKVGYVCNDIEEIVKSIVDFYSEDKESKKSNKTVKKSVKTKKIRKK